MACSGTKSIPPILNKGSEMSNEQQNGFSAVEFKLLVDQVTPGSAWKYQGKRYIVLCKTTDKLVVVYKDHKQRIGYYPMDMWVSSFEFEAKGTGTSPETAILQAEKEGAAQSTPASAWREKGEEDPHKGRYDGERAQLMLGKYTDDELANGMFMNYDVRLSFADMTNPKPGQHMPIVWMTAGKERIRWLSRALEKEIAKNQQTVAPVGYALMPILHDGKAGLTDVMMRAFYEAFEANSQRGSFERLNAGYNAMVDVVHGKQLKVPDVTFVGGTEPTHRCKVCGSLWLKYQDTEQKWFWNLRSKECGPCCNNVLMGQQIEELPKNLL
jgi:hypothetical protein